MPVANLPVYTFVKDGENAQGKGNFSGWRYPGRLRPGWRSYVRCSTARVNCGISSGGAGGLAVYRTYDRDAIIAIGGAGAG
jgi:hypothetical protein